MRFAALTQLSPEGACSRLVAVDTERKLQLAEWLALIALIDERRDYRAAGYSSMSAFCMRRLHLTLDRSLRLIQVARVAQRHPLVFDFLADGRLGLTTLSELAPALRDDGSRVARRLHSRRRNRSAGCWRIGCSEWLSGLQPHSCSAGSERRRTGW
jgi:hypothetical protein